MIRLSPGHAGAALAALALAAPAARADAPSVALPHSGRILGADDAPAAGPVKLHFELHSAPQTGSADRVVWHDDFDSVSLDRNGTYSLALGDAEGSAGAGHTAFHAADFDGERWLAVSVNGVALSPWLRLGTAPSALNAQTVGGFAASATPAANKLLPLDAGGRLPLSVLSQAGAQTDGWLSKTDWAAFSAKMDKLQVSPGALTGDGTAQSPLALAIGNGANQVAAGDHVHPNLVALNAAQPQAGTVAVTRVVADSFIGSGAGLTNLDPTKLSGPIADSQLASGTVLAKTTAANTFGQANTFQGNVTIGGQLAFAGTPAKDVKGMRLENAAQAPVTCDASNKGYVYFDTVTSTFKGCDGTAPFKTLGAGLAAQVVSNGLVLHLDGANTNSYPGSGAFWKDVSGAGSASMGNVDLSVGNFSYDANTQSMFNGTDSTGGGMSVSLASFPKQEGTAEFWVMALDYSGSNGLFVNRIDSTPNAADWIWMGPYASGFNNYLRIGDGSNCCIQEVNSPRAAPAGQWVQYVYSWSNSGKVLRAGRNGVFFASHAVTNIPATNPSTTGRIGIGHLNSQSQFKGHIAIVRFYNRPLSVDEVKQNFEANRARFGL